MRLARSMLAAVFFGLYGLGSLLIGVLLFPPLAMLGMHRWMRTLVRWSWQLFVWGGRLTGLFRVEISSSDRARLASTRGRVVVANHLTLIDVVILMSLLPDATAVVKTAARANFFYSAIVKGAFIVNDDPAQVLERSARLLAEGTDLVVFPEGTRTPANAPSRRLRRGAAQIALNASAPVLPVFIECDPPVLAKGQPWYDAGDRTVVWTLRVRDELPVDAVPEKRASHAAAVSLTAAIYGRLWA